MFKELGEFIDNAGRRVGFIAKKLLSKDEPHEIHGYFPEPIDEHEPIAVHEPIDEHESIDELVKQGVITKEEAEELKNVEIYSK